MISLKLQILETKGVKITMKVSDLMNTQAITLTPDCPVTEASRILGKNDIGSAPVCGADGIVIGMLTDRDIVTRCVATRSDPSKTTVREVMTRGVVSVHPDEDIRNAARIMAGEQVRRLPVINGGHIVGVISLADIVHSDLYKMEASQTLTGITEPEHGF